MRTPATIGRYALLEPLASGGMGVVFRAVDPLAQREVALKVLRGEGLVSPVARQRFLREAQALRGLDHPGIVRCLDAGEEAGVPFLVMDLLRGRALVRRMEESGRLPVREAAEVALELAGALAHAHARGVLHRDVKPANVVVTEEGRHVLVDFGLARLLLEDLPAAERLSRTGQMLGTPGYWAPEQAMGERNAATPAADVHGLGATLYAMLVGRPPYEGVSLSELFDAQARGPAPPRRDRPEIDAELDRLVMRCLARDPAQRPVAVDLETELAAWLDREAAPRGKPVLALALGAGLALSGVVGGVLLARGWARSDLPPSGTPATDPSPVGTSPGEPSPVVATTGAPAPATPPQPGPAPTGPPRTLPTGVSPGRAPGEFVHARSGQVLVWIPPGELVMGGEDGDPDERPPHRVTFPGFFLGKYETSWAQWLTFCHADGRPDPDRKGREGTVEPLDHPASMVSWSDAQRYCRWAGLRLPSEAEWEYAARGAHGGPWPWGHEPPDATRLNVADQSARWKWPEEVIRQGVVKAAWDDAHPWSAPVNAFPAGATPWGCLNMAGNVNEWTQDRYHDSYQGAPQDGSAWEQAGETKRVFRGGCHYFGVKVARATYRARAPAEMRYLEQGLRVALSH